MLKKMLHSAVLGTTVLASSSLYALEIHEWGTFTSMVNENGQTMSGMHHEEEGLPGFVYGLRSEGPGLQNSAQFLGGNKCRGKCSFYSANDSMTDVLPYNQFNTTVTQKMETPVIYFYGNAGEKVEVNVGFPSGMISQWYPAASNFNLHNEEPTNGFMTWNVTLKDANDTNLYPRTTAKSIWNPARATKANTIQTNVNGTEEERFIFYRGLANFDVPLKLALKNISDSEMSVTITNTSNEKVPALFYLKTNADGVERFLTLPVLGPNETKTFLTSSAQTIKSAHLPIHKALVEAGLFADEAQGMLNTWNKSYFHTTGERLLYILPQAWTENILPMKLTPEPQKLVRVLVGRIELFSAAAENSVLRQVNADDMSLSQDHLMEAKLNAVKQRVMNSKTIANKSTLLKIDQLILKMNQ